MNEWVSVDEGLSLAETCSGYFSYCCDKPSLRRFYLGLQLEAKIHHGGKFGPQQCGAAGHRAAAVKRQRETDAGAQPLLSPLSKVQNASPGMVLPIVRVGLSSVKHL